MNPTITIEVTDSLRETVKALRESRKIEGDGLEDYTLHEIDLEDAIIWHPIFDDRQHKRYISLICVEHDEDNPAGFLIQTGREQDGVICWTYDLTRDGSHIDEHAGDQILEHLQGLVDRYNESPQS